MKQKKDIKEKHERIGIMVASVLISVVVTLVSAWKFTNTDVSATEQVTYSFDSLNIGISLILGCVTFIMVELISLVFYSISYNRQKMEDETFMDNITEYSQKLHEINRFYYKISRDSHGEQDLFVTYAKKEIEKLYMVLGNAANQKVFSISTDYIVNVSGVFEAFSQTDEKILKMTFPISVSDDAVFTSPADMHFFEVLKAKVESKQVDMVKVIVVLEGEILLERQDVRTLLDFFKATSGYECKIASKVDFETVCESNGINSQFIDFGIYGPKMLYVTEQYIPHKGTYYKDEAKVRLYHLLFDEVWTSDVITRQNPSSNEEKIALKDLISKRK